MVYSYRLMTGQSNGLHHLLLDYLWIIIILVWNKEVEAKINAQITPHWAMKSGDPALLQHVLHSGSLCIRRCLTVVWLFKFLSLSSLPSPSFFSFVSFLPLFFTLYLSLPSSHHPALPSPINLWIGHIPNPEVFSVRLENKGELCIRISKGAEGTVPSNR